ncbi:MAG: hypothetical protein J6J93_04015 [Muribaculaceae bacterium]|nr:hypothetical protein [Muribaculaceae bacterium]
MKKIICIGECSLNLVVDASGKPLGSLPGGRIANAASILGRDGLKVLMASEACADSIGDIIVGNLSASGVDVTSVDRFTEGRTPLNVFVTDPGNPQPKLIRYEAYPEEAFDIIWPRIDEGDIIVFGGYYSIDRRMRPRMQRLLAHAAERKAVMVYLPGFLPQQEPRITRVMPQILENLEMAHVVVTRNRDLELIFGVKLPDACYHDHIDFYCRSLVNIDDTCRRISYYTGKEVSSVDIPERICRTLMWNSGALAGLTAAIFERNLSADVFDAPDAQTREALLGAAAKSAMSAAESLTEAWQFIE